MNHKFILFTTFLLISAFFSSILAQSELLERNNFLQIEELERSILFKSKSVQVEWNPFINELKSIKISSNEISPKENISQDYPKGFGDAAYISVKDRVKKGGSEIILFSAASEGIYSSALIADINNNKEYSYNEKTQAINFTNNYIWLGKENGFAVLNRDKNVISEYLILPFLSPNSKVFSNNNFIFITHDRLGIEIIDKSKNEVTFVSLEDMNRGNAAAGKSRLSIHGLPFFTNIIETDNLVILGCHILQDESMGIPGGRGSYLLFYHKNQNYWEKRNFDEDGLFRLFKIKNKLILAFRLIEHSEGDPHINHGGIYSYDLSTDDFTMLSNTEKDMMISYQADSSLINIKSYSEIYHWGKNRDFDVTGHEYIFDTDLNIISAEDSLNYDINKSRHESHQFLKSLSVADSLVIAKNIPLMNALEPHLYIFNMTDAKFRVVNR